MIVAATLRSFIGDESGAITVDWVALTAAILLLGIAVVYYLFETGVTTTVETVDTGFDAVDPALVQVKRDLSGPLSNNN